MKILVTGANGYLGSGIVKAILDSGNEVVAADFKTDHIDGRAIKMDCNLFEVEDPFHYFGEPDVLLHLAWRDGFVHYADSHIADLPRHYSFIKKMAESGVRQICGMGSMCVLQSQSFQYPSLPEVRGKGQNNDEHDDWSSSNQRWSRCDGGSPAAGGSQPDGSKRGTGGRAGGSERTHHPVVADCVGVTKLARAKGYKGE